ncbi:AAA ATPase central domain-containing protein (plasmid) [Cylindrospermum sp. NIES-4074]|nr:AAA ATPase central domain-containing protein [Cylindrospermum sp. NIES-4074]
MTTHLSTPELTSSWLEANQNYLIKATTRVQEALQNYLHQMEDIPHDEKIENWKVSEDFHSASLDSGESSNLEKLCDVFDLSPFERDVLLLCAGAELNRSWSLLFAKIQSNPQNNYPTFSLALEVLPEAHWSALMPDSSLRRWRMIEVGPGNTLTTSALRIDERILHYLTGVQHLDERLTEIEMPIPEADYLVSSHQKIAEELAYTWVQALQETELLPVLQLCGPDVTSKLAIATVSCALLGLNLYAISAEALPTNTNQLNLIKRLCEREWALSDRVLLLDCDQVETEATRESAIARFIESINCPLIITSRDRRRQRQRPLITFDVQQPTADEQQLIWQNALGEITPTLKEHIEILVSNFSLNPPAIQTACLKVRSAKREKQEEEETTNTKIQHQLWDICRNQARPRLDELAQRIELTVGWDDLVLPDKERHTLRQIIAHVAQRSKVYNSWGFGSRSGRGLGISALFAGVSGTGKTTAAELVAKELRLDLYRIDLSSVVSKYIGETEKNLRRVFDAAEAGGVVLLFDEADSLFGKRSDVKDSHDRYANMEVSYLLQRMESYRGLGILTTNLKNSIDQAFLRRIRFVVTFPFPDAVQREEIWQRVFPSRTPTEGLDYTKLAKLSVTGGNIRNIAMNAAFIAADAGEPVEMKHILQATRNECIKLVHRGKNN